MNGQDSEKLTAGLRALAASMESQSPPAGLETTLKRAFRRRKSRRMTWAMIGTAAAGVLIGALLASRDTAPVRIEPAAPRPAPAPVIARQPAAEPVQAAMQPRTSTRRRRPVQRFEVVTPFFPVAGGDLLSPLDRGGVIRVQLPRSALMVFGVPMNEARAAESVKADVLVGEDGLARAIRFVQ
jgi:hypothetical protein